MGRSRLANELLATAKTDLKAMAHMLDPLAFDERIFGFHAQQAVEKALKAWLDHLQGSHPYTHDLSLLLHTLDALGEDIQTCWTFVDLTGYAVRFRYETLPEGEEPLDREALTASVVSLLERVDRLVAPE